MPEFTRMELLLISGLVTMEWTSPRMPLTRRERERLTSIAEKIEKEG